jgi:subfamily B ATP-binding cassette protein MsbA
MLSGRISIGDVFFITVALSYFTNAINKIVSFNVNLNSLKAARAFVKEIYEHQEKDGTEIVTTIDSVEIRSARVRAGEKILLKDVNLNLEKGDIVGIVGPSGSGKSTLAKALLKFRTGHNVFINGIPIEKVANHAYRNRVAYYSQNVPIISASMLDNLNFGRTPVEADDYKKLKFLGKFFEDDSELKNIVVENGNNLSGGDKQRIALARTFFETADIIVLDEPTNSLDQTTEKELLSAILNDSADKIIVFITHNAEHLSACNKVYRVQGNELRLV